VNLWQTALLVAAAVAATVGLFLFARRFAPAEGFFVDGDRAAGVFGVLATGFAVLLGFVIFLAFVLFVIPIAVAVLVSLAEARRRGA